MVSYKYGDYYWIVGWFLGDEYGSGVCYDWYLFDVVKMVDLFYKECECVYFRYEYMSFLNEGELLFGVFVFCGQVQNIIICCYYDY